MDENLNGEITEESDNHRGENILTFHSTSGVVLLKKVKCVGTKTVDTSNSAISFVYGQLLSTAVTQHCLRAIEIDKSNMKRRYQQEGV